MPSEHPGDASEISARRARLLGPKVSTFYDEPLHVVRAKGVWLWDQNGRKYLDCYNNVPHVGHCNSRVVEATARQAATLNTHTRYLHEGILDYLDRLTCTFGKALDAAVMTCTGSEANDLAIRMAEAATGKSGIIATDWTYHGNTALVSQLSRSNSPGVGKALSGFARFVPAPDSYRPLGGVAGMAHANAFARAVRERIEELEESRHGFAAAIFCPFFVNEGFPDLPEGWLKPAVQEIRKAGGIVIADEVQPGFGRIGTHMWGHLRQGIQPDIVTLGKPMANGHPVGAVVAGSALLASFQTKYRYFNTFGGNPVSCAAAMAVLDEIEEKGLLENARRVGEFARQRLNDLALKHEIVGDTRGSGLIFGAEFVLDCETKKPATDFTSRVVNQMRDRGIVLGSLGRSGNTLKIRPPMTFSRENADFLFDALDQVLTTALR